MTHARINRAADSPISYQPYIVARCERVHKAHYVVVLEADGYVSQPLHFPRTATFTCANKDGVPPVGSQFVLHYRLHTDDLAADD